MNKLKLSFADILILFGMALVASAVVGVAGYCFYVLASGLV